jgi:hypothetical protein
MSDYPSSERPGYIGQLQAEAQVPYRPAKRKITRQVPQLDPDAPGIFSPFVPATAGWNWPAANRRLKPSPANFGTSTNFASFLPIPIV